VCAALTLATAGCGFTVTAPSDIVSRTWQLASLQRTGAEVVVPSVPSRYILRFDDDGRVSVMSDCNSCGGTFAIDADVVEIAPLTCTKVACDAGTLDPEYTAALQGRKAISRSGSELILTGNGSTLRFVAR
jgi:heat shock protein HslJ